MAEFEFGPNKSAGNKAKHAIDFTEAQEIWRDELRLEVPARSADEPRFQIIGTARGQLWSAFITYRGRKVRIISVRPSRPEERRMYEKKT